MKKFKIVLSFVFDILTIISGVICVISGLAGGFLAGIGALMTAFDSTIVYAESTCGIWATRSFNAFILSALALFMCMGLSRLMDDSISDDNLGLSGVEPYDEDDDDFDESKVPLTFEEYDRMLGVDNSAEFDVIDEYGIRHKKKDKDKQEMEQ